MYTVDEKHKKLKLPKSYLVIFSILSISLIAFGSYKYVFSKTPEQKVTNYLTFDQSVSPEEQEQIKSSISQQNINVTGLVNVLVSTTKKPENLSLVTQSFVPVTNIYSIRQKVTADELSNMKLTLYAAGSISPELAQTIGANQESLVLGEGEVSVVSEESVAFIPVDKISVNVKLLEYDGNYYLDSYNSGAVFREATFEGEGASALSNIKLNSLPTKEDIFKTNTTGVTALTRVMSRKLASVKDPLYFSAKIGDFVADADLTHVSNEVSFKPGCGYSDTLFCSPPEFIETLKASGVDLVELTGNHNNDTGNIYNTQTIELYKSLGWGTVGGGLNDAEAKLPYLANQKGSKVTYLAYNYPDSPNGGAISSTTTAGANRFDFDFTAIAADIATAKQSSDFVQVNVQFWECYAYPDGFVEFPICDKPIGEQEATFKKLIDLGADMVVGSSAHQPQTYEMYNGKPIYYGLGNLYFDQTQWPGTERGIILTNYFDAGKLIQTKLTPTVYDRDLQTRIMTDSESDYFLTRLHDAR